MIYFIQDTASLLIKIGFTDGDPQVRLKALQTGSASQLVLLFACEGNKDDESAMHAMFASSRMRGEWFSSTPHLLTFILQKAKIQGAEIGYNRGLKEPCNCDIPPPWLDLDSRERGREIIWRDKVNDRQVGPCIALRCPVCNFGCNHTREQDQEEFDTWSRPQELLFSCENGHYWSLKLDFDAGHTVIFAVHDGDEEQHVVDTRF